MTATLTHHASLEQCINLVEVFGFKCPECMFAEGLVPWIVCINDEVIKIPLWLDEMLAVCKE